MESLQFLPLVVQVPCNSIVKAQSDSLTIRVNYTWKGATQTLTGYAVVTQTVWWNEFDEIGSSRINFSVVLPDSHNSTTSGYFIVPGLPLYGCAPGTNYGVKIKTDNFGEFGAKYVLTITSASGAEFSINSLVLS